MQIRSLMRELFDDLRTDLIDRADPERAAGMEAYLRDQFECFGIGSKERREVSKIIVRSAKAAAPDEVLGFADLCWAEPMREFHYVGMDALRASAKNLRHNDLDHVRSFIERHSWWDTVDSLAAWTVGPIVFNHDLGHVMDVWIDDPNIWVARTAIIHQLGYKADANPDRLFDYALRRAGDTEFFIRKAIGWSLRQYARVDPDAVRSFVAANEDMLSGLTKREALKHLTPK